MQIYILETKMNNRYKKEQYRKSEIQSTDYHIWIQRDRTQNSLSYRWV